jgi:3-deoxy-D-manno-octulosonate 8-phosphate phosphatase (KDO 8-P phosphatase)
MDKVEAMKEFMRDYAIDAENVIYMGDDIPDLECMRLVGIPVCPADAAMEVVEASRYVSEYNGGRGAVRDIIEQVLRAKNLWAKNLKGLLGSKDK